jgi:hypothetical protein
MIPRRVCSVHSQMAVRCPARQPDPASCSATDLQIDVNTSIATSGELGFDA